MINNHVQWRKLALVALKQPKFEDIMMQYFFDGTLTIRDRLAHMNRS